MPLVFSENWDEATAPAIPSGWNAGVPYETSTTNAYSSPNALKVNTVSSGVYYFATYSGADPGHGAVVDVSTLIYVDSSAPSGNYYGGPTFRCSASTMDLSTTACYWARLLFNSGASTTGVRFSYVIDGTVTDLVSLDSAADEIVAGEWFKVRVTSPGGNLFTVQVTRMSDGFTLDSAGNFNAGSWFAITNYHATVAPLSAGDYSGLASSSADAGRIYFDDFNVNTSTVIAYPRKPVIARVPFQYYITD